MNLISIFRDNTTGIYTLYFRINKSVYPCRIDSDSKQYLVEKFKLRRKDRPELNGIHWIHKDLEAWAASVEYMSDKNPLLEGFGFNSEAPGFFEIKPSEPKPDDIPF